jgi:hypothetical protein
MSETSTVLDRVPSDDLDTIARLGTWLAAAESKSDDPKTKGAAAALRLYLARELGLPPLAASELSLIQGKLVVSAKLLRAIAGANGYRVVPKERTPKSCTAAVVDKRTGETLGTYTFTMEDARAAGLVRERSAWQTHPARMLWARAAKFALDDAVPEVTLGLVTDDEAAEIRNEPVPPPENGGEEEVEEAEVVEGEQSQFQAPEGATA